MSSPYVFRIGDTKAVITAQEAYLLAYVVRHLRVGRVKRTGRRGQRAFILNPRNKAEWAMGRGVLRGHH